MALAVATLCWFSCQESSQQRPASPTNVLLISIDTTRADALGCYGSERGASPTLDQLAREGIVFEQAFAPVPMTLPSHSTLLTGLNPPRHSVRENSVYSLPESAWTLAEILSAEGYSTFAVVAAVVMMDRFGLQQGFARYDQDSLSLAEGQGKVERSATEIVDRCLQQIPTEGPFFGFVHFYDPHQPWTPPDDLAEQFAGNAQDLYYAEIAAVDRQIQRVLDFLQANGQLEQTLVVITADHGESRGEHHEWSHGNLLHDATQHIPLILTHPTLPPQRVADVVSLADVMPTILEFLELEIPSNLDGRALQPLWNGTGSSPGIAYLETQSPLSTYNWSPLFGVRTQRWKYIEGSRPHLYDLQQDPGENQNVVDQYPREAERLALRLHALRSEGQRLDRDPRTLSDDERRVLGSLGYLSDAVTSADQNYADLPDPIDSSAELEKFKRALLLMNAKNFRGALAILEPLSVQFPTTFLVRQNLGICYDAIGKPDLALIECLAAVGLRPRSPVIHLNTAIAANGTNNPGLARHHLQTAVSLPGCPPRAYFLLVEHWRQAGDRERAQQVLDELLKLPDLSDEERQQATRLLR